MPIAHLKDVNIYYEQIGNGSDLVLIGGLSTNHLMWGSMFNELSKNYRVTIFDNRGAGLSSQPDSLYTAEVFAEDTINLMDYLNIRHAYMVGHSMGGIILQSILIHYPERVNAAIIASSSFNFPEISKNYFTYVLSLLEMETDPEKIFNLNIPWLYGAKFSSDQSNIRSELNRLVGNPYPQTIQGYYGQINALNTFDSLASLSEIKIPVLILSGEDDIISPLSHQFKFESLISQCDLSIVEDCGHMLYRECPERFTEEIMNFCH